MPFEVRVRGQREVETRFTVLHRAFPQLAQQALRVEAEIEMGEMKARTPVRTGALRASGRVEDLPGGGIRWAFGGPAIDYAVAVHENLEAFHHVGQAKYMESVLVESMPHLGQRVATRLRHLIVLHGGGG